MKSATPLTILLALTALCCGAPQEGTRTDRPGLPYAVITGSGGGFTGLREGYVIDSLGDVSRWRGVVFDRSERTFVGTLSEAECRDLADFVATSGVLDTSCRGSGNISSFVALRSASLSREYSWPGVEPGQDVPEAVRKLHGHVARLIRSIATSH